MTTSELRSVHANGFKLAMRTLVGGVTIIAARDLNGSYVGLTATAVCSLSVEPPSLIVCINRQAGLAEALAAGRHFSVNILTAAQEPVARAFGGLTAARGVGRFTFGNWHRGATEVPLLSHARANLECVTDEVIEKFTHLVVIGRVVSLRLDNPQDTGLAADNGQMVPVPTLAEVMTDRRA